jgi:hypothetical protein
MTSGPVLAVSAARSNAELVRDCARLGYLSRSMHVLDPTYGKAGGFWRLWRPDHLVACDLDPTRSPIGFGVDFTELPFPRTFDAVTLDGPYKLNGSGGSHESDDRFGVATSGVSWQAKHALIVAGIAEAARVLVPGGTLLVKCQDQVCGGAVRFQTDEFTAAAHSVGCSKIDALHLVGHRPQPEWQTCRRCKGTGLEKLRVHPVCQSCHGAGRFRPTQQHALRNHSTLLVFRKARR